MSERGVYPSPDRQMKRLESLLYFASSRLLGLAAFPLLSAEAQLCIALLSLTLAASLQTLGSRRLPL